LFIQIIERHHAVSKSVVVEGEVFIEMTRNEIKVDEPRRNRDMICEGTRKMKINTEPENEAKVEQIK
jgi:hypothetical protein